MTRTLQLKMYNFLGQSLRESDRRDGYEFAKRLLVGGQQLWSDTFDRIESMRDLWSYVDCPDEYLQYLKWIVGWTSELDHITDGLGAVVLRRLIASSAPLWKTRGPEPSITNVLSFVPGVRSRVLNWFDFRWIVGETGLHESTEDSDAWLIEVAGGSPPSENFMHLRVVDGGSLDRTLTKNLVNLMRATGERIEVAYTMFLDLFERDGDNVQWETVTSSPMMVADGKLAVAADHEAHIDVGGSLSWDDYAVWSRIAVTADSPLVGRKAGVLFYLQPPYALVVSLDIDDNKITLWKFTFPSTYVQVASHTFDPWGELVLGSGTWYTIRAEVKNIDATDSHIKVYLDAEPYIDMVLSDVNYKDGTAGLMADADSSLECGAFEVYPIPMDVDLVDINY